MTQNSSQETARTLLIQCGGRITQARIGVLGILLDASAALSHQEVEIAANERGLTLDRVTLYRTLDWLVENGMAHRIAGVDRVWRYNAQSGLTHHHAHFQCKQCKQIFCLENLQPALLFTIPSGYQLEEVELNLQGTCPNCVPLLAT